MACIRFLFANHKAEFGCRQEEKQVPAGGVQAAAAGKARRGYLTDDSHPQ
jgi:hypothetical protein